METETLASALPREIERCSKLVEIYRQLGPVGNWGRIMIQRDIDAAQAAIAAGDVVAMIRAYQALKECK